MSIKKEFEKMQESITNPFEALDEIVLRQKTNWFGRPKRDKNGAIILEPDPNAEPDEVVPVSEPSEREKKQADFQKSIEAQKKAGAEAEARRKARAEHMEKNPEDSVHDLAYDPAAPPVYFPPEVLDQGPIGNVFNRADQKDKIEFITSLLDLLITDSRTGQATKSWFVKQINSRLHK